MDTRLEDRLKKYHAQIEKLKEVELQYLELDASEKSLFAELFLQAEGRSISEREARAAASPEWKDFKRGLAQAESARNHERRRLDLLQNAFNAEYTTYKIEAEAIKRSA